MSTASTDLASTTDDPLEVDPKKDTDDDTTTADGESHVGTMDRKTLRQKRHNILRNCKHPTKESVHQAQKALEELTQESILTGNSQASIAIYNNVINATAKSGVPTAFRKAIQMLEKMHERHEKYPHCCPAPDNVTYFSTLFACTNGSAMKQLAAAEEADRLIRQMEEISKKNPDGGVHPESRSYDLVILAHSNLASYKYG